MGKAQDACRVTTDKDPCWKESKMSMNCLSDNGFDKSQCIAYFENYKKCKTFWMEVKFARRNAGIYPAVPTTDEERAAFKAKYLKTGEIPLHADD